MIWQSIKRFIKGVINILFPSKVLKEYYNDNMSKYDEYMQYMYKWKSLFLNTPCHDNNIEKHTTVAKAIAQRTAQAVTLELQSEIIGSARADYLNNIYQKLLKKVLNATEIAVALGGIVFKPVIVDGDVKITLTLPEHFYPIKSNAEDIITECLFVDRVKKNNDYYTKIEHHIFNRDTYTITNTAYVSDSENELGNKTKLTDIYEWQGIKDKLVLVGATMPFYSYFKMPFTNVATLDELLGMSLYHPVLNLIADANEQYDRLNWENKAGEIAIDVDETLMQGNSQDGYTLPTGNARMYRSYAQTGGSDNNPLFNVYNPDLRNEEMEKFLDLIFSMIEKTIGLQKGFLSNADTVEKTATEIIASKQTFYVIVSHIQNALKDALKNLVDSVDNIIRVQEFGLSNPPPEGDYEVTFEFDDSIIIDEETRRRRYIEEYNLGIISDIELRMHLYGETVEEATQRIPKQQVEELEL